MKNWIKGGIFGVMAALLVGIFYQLYAVLFYGLSHLKTPHFLLPFVFFGILFSIIGLFGCSFKYDPCTLEVIFGTVVSVLIYFSIGAVIGYLFDLYKKKSSEKKRIKNKK